MAKKIVVSTVKGEIAEIRTAVSGLSEAVKALMSYQLQQASQTASQPAPASQPASASKITYTEPINLSILRVKAARSIEGQARLTFKKLKDGSDGEDQFRVFAADVFVVGGSVVHGIHHWTVKGHGVRKPADKKN